MGRQIAFFNRTWIVASLTVAGCGSGGDFPVAQTAGTVMCEGQPVPYVTVFFEPLATGESALVGKQGIGIADEQGKFIVSTYGDGDGAVVGKHRVRVMGPDRDSHPNFSCPCVLNSELDVMQVEVKSSDKNEFEVVLQKKTGKEQPSLEELEAMREASARSQ
jgi:hypothetical protein